MKDILKITAIVLAVFFIGYTLEEAVDQIIDSNVVESLEDVLEIISEFFSVFVALSVFAMTWHAYNKSRDNHSLFLGTTFLVVGLLSMFHLLSYPFMPEFITPNSPHKAAIFLIGSRVILAISFLASVYIYKDTLPKLINKSVLLSSAVAISAISLVAILFYNDYLFAAYDFDSYSTVTISLWFITTAVILYASYLYSIRFKETEQKNLIFLVYGSIIVVFSNLVYFSYEFSGHFLIITGFFFMYLALYKSSVELPYEKLAVAEEKLRRAAEEKYRNLFDNATDAIVTCDLEENITSWNQSAEKVFGWKAQEAIGKKISQLLVPSKMLARRDKIVNDVLSGGIVSGIDVLCPHKNGTMVNVSLTVSPLRDAAQNIIGLSGIMRDITERKRAEGALEIALKEWKETFNAISDGVWILDTEGRIIQSNGVFERMLGLRTEDVLNQYCYKTVHCTSEFIEQCPFKRMKQTGKRESEELEDKERGIWLQVVVDPVRDESGEVKRGVHIVRNITERKKAEQVRLENDRLEHASKTKSEFLANMSHELRTPLNSIIGFSELLKESSQRQLNDKQLHYVDNVLTSSKFLLDLINDILDLSKVEAGKVELVIESISAPETINEAITLIKEKATKHNVILKKELDPALGFIEADPQRLKQILFNLLSNAVKFSKVEGGTVTVTAKKEGDMASFSVSDTGIGIKEENIVRLFKEFEQLNPGISRIYGGSGLGLAITKKLVKLHGGKIWVVSKLGEGSTFTFELPISSKSSEIK